MLNLENLEALRFWQSDEGQRLLALLDQHSLYLGFKIASYPLRSCFDLLSYFGIESVLQHFQQVRDSAPIRVLDIGCGNGWEAFGLAFLLQPATVIGISNDPDTVQAWDKRSHTAGAFLETLPRLLKDIKGVQVWIGDSPERSRLLDLGSRMKGIHENSLEFMRHDIQTPGWPGHMSSFDLAFSRSSFYHTQDRIQALRNIRVCLADSGIYILHEPSIRNDGSPDLTSEWLCEAAVQEVGFAHCEILDSSERSTTALLKK